VNVTRVPQNRHLKARTQPPAGESQARSQRSANQRRQWGHVRNRSGPVGRCPSGWVTSSPCRDRRPAGQLLGAWFDCRWL